MNKNYYNYNIKLEKFFLLSNWNNITKIIKFTILNYIISIMFKILIAIFVYFIYI